MSSSDDSGFHAPAGWMQDSQGRWVPPSQISPVDRARHELVTRLAESADDLSQSMAFFKGMAFDAIAKFIDTSCSQYGAKLGGAKGNVVLYSFDGSIKIERRFVETLRFGEQLQAAKALIDECLMDWTQDGRDEIRVIVQDAFRTDSKGDVSTSKIFSLRRHKFDDPRWRAALRAIDDSLQVVGSACYLRIYRRTPGTNAYRQIVLDVSSANLGEQVGG